MVDVNRYASHKDLPEELFGRLLHADALFVTREWTEVLSRSNPAIAVEWWVASHGLDCTAIPVHVQFGPPSRATYNVSNLFAPEIGNTREVFESCPHALVGTRNGQGNGFIRSGDRNSIAEMVLLNEILACHSEGVVGMLYTDREIARGLRDLERRPDVVRLIDVSAHITLRGESIEQVVDDFPGRRRRMKIRQELRRAAQAQPLDVLDRADDIDAVAPALAPLARAVNERHGQSTTDEKMLAYIRSIAHSGLRPVLFLGSTDEAPKSFSIGVTDGTTLSIRTCGFDYSRVSNGPLEYARCVVYEPMEWAFDQKLSVLDLGTGTLHAKTLRGAKPFPLYGALWSPVGIDIGGSPEAERILIQSILESAPRLDPAIVSSWGIGSCEP